MADPVDPAPAQGGGTWLKLRRLGGQSGLYLIGDALSKSLALLLLPLYLRYLQPSDYGILAIGTTLTILLAIVLGLALQGAIQRIYFEMSSDHERRTLYATVLWFLVLVPGLAVVALELLGRAGALELFPSAPYDPYLRLAVLTAYLNVFREIPVAIYTVRGQAPRVVALLVSNALLTAALTVVLVIFEDRGALGALEAMLGAAAVVAVASVALTIYESHFHVSGRLLKISLAFGLPLVPHLVGHWALALADRAVLDRFVAADIVGTYALGANVAAGAILVINGSGRAFTPMMTREMKGEDGGARVPVLGTWWVAGMIWCCTAIALLGGPLIRLLFSEDYAAAERYIPLLVLGYLAFGIYTIVTQGTWFSMRMRMVPVLTLIAAVLNIGLALVLIPQVGAIGAAVATVVGFTALAIMQGMLSQALHPIRWEYGRWVLLGLAGGAAFAIGSLGGAEPSALSFLLRVAALFVVFPAMLLALRFFTAGERLAISSRLRRLSLGGT